MYGIPLLILILFIVIGMVTYYNSDIFDRFGVLVTVDVSGRRNVNESEILDEWLIAHFNSYSDIRFYFYRRFDEWDDKAKKVLAGVLLFRAHREEQYYALREQYSNKYYDFFYINTVRYQTRYKQVNYIKMPYSVPVENPPQSYSLVELKNVCKGLEASGFTLSRNKYFSKNQRSLMTPELKRQVKIRDNYTCQCCGKYMPDEVGLHIDHITPVSRGGKSILSNFDDYGILIHRAFQEILYLAENKAWLCTSASLGLEVLPFCVSFLYDFLHESTP